MRCPICEGALDKVLVRDVGGVTGDLFWQIHAGECPEHGWFQAEVVSRPPREIFPVERPFGPVRRLIVNGREIFTFPTAWNELPADEKRRRVDPLEARYWRVSRLVDSAGESRFGQHRA